MIHSSISSIIQKRLRQIERDHGVRILYACESGSRAWGFPSRDSDYDVRFIYVHSREWYLRIDRDQQRDTLEFPIEGDIDLSGWDLTKALSLLRKSNPPLLEWLRSPIVYLETSAARRLRKLAVDYFSPISCAWHYLSMARTNCRDYLKGKQVLHKKYFYVLRPLLAVLWIEKGKGAVPMEFDQLVDALVKKGPLHTEITQLIARRRAAKELDASAPIPILHSFIEKELFRLEKPKFPKPKERSMERLNAFFRSTLASSYRIQRET